MKIKKTAGKRSGVSYLARETERRAALAEAERRREARKWKGVEGRANAVGGLFGKGTFE
jgi:mediator of replication checkpoint protein 1